ncbi:MAG: AAA family ATPase [Corynebacterium sp.]|uniref:ATP-binding protein n=1 Tax=Corynebacterium sp. TaxID=1720 RepID=UPI0026DB100A|nr:AAA family ATPase [Corynebacterium sp.]MDO5029272.1 AAA family ATPase [Corynebacterium sp.]
MEKIASTSPRNVEPTFPFTAIVGQERLQLALILTALVPEIGGVVIRGEKGTAKTTTVRALAPFLSGLLVNLPLGATEDRVVGSIDVETVLTTGHARFNPGLLSAADGGILYVDEINLLPDHLVDSVLDAAATGRVVVERDGISHSATSRFVLVGTMNPEEGELRPQLLDRFGLAIDVVASKDPSIRAEIVSRRLDFDANPEDFVTRFADADAALKDRIERARTLLDDVALTPTVLGQIASVCAAFDVDGMRADIVIARTARAHAAWRVAEDESAQPGEPIGIDQEDIKVAAEMALPHRRRRDPFDEPGLDQDQLDDALDQAQEEFPEEPIEEPDDADSIGQTEQDAQPEQPENQPAAGGKAGRANAGAPFRRS